MANDMTTVRQALNDATAAFASLSATPRLDAELLMAHALHLTREAMLTRAIDAPAPAGFGPLVTRRLAHEPIAYIVGTRAFWTIELAIAPGVLIPRPDSETLIEAAVAHFGRAGPARVLDLGVGSGALLLAALAEWPGATGLGVDRSEVAIGQARANAAALGLADRAEIREGDWAEGIDGPFDLVLCNPPYVESGAALDAQVADYEPASALYAGRDGLDDYRRLAPMMGRLIAPAGMAAIEIGESQATAVVALFAEWGLNGSVHQDLAGRDRCVVLTR